MEIGNFFTWLHKTCPTFLPLCPPLWVPLLSSDCLITKKDHYTTEKGYILGVCPYPPEACCPGKQGKPLEVQEPPMGFATLVQPMRTHKLKKP